MISPETVIIVCFCLSLSIFILKDTRFLSDNFTMNLIENTLALNGFGLGLVISWNGPIYKLLLFAFGFIITLVHFTSFYYEHSN